MRVQRALFAPPPMTVISRGAPPIRSRVEPNDLLREHYSRRIELYRDLYQRLRPVFGEANKD
jgi:hypothetical protein